MKGIPVKSFLRNPVYRYRNINIVESRLTAGKISCVSSGGRRRGMISFSGLMAQRKIGGEGMTVQLARPGIIKLLRQ